MTEIKTEVTIEQTKWKIALGMVVAIANVGYNASIHQIAEEASVTPNTVHYYFKGKVDLFILAIRVAAERIEELLLITEPEKLIQVVSFRFLMVARVEAMFSEAIRKQYQECIEYIITESAHNAQLDGCGESEDKWLNCIINWVLSGDR